MLVTHTGEDRLAGVFDRRLTIPFTDLFPLFESSVPLSEIEIPPSAIEFTLNEIEFYLGEFFIFFQVNLNFL